MAAFFLPNVPADATNDCVRRWVHLYYGILKDTPYKWLDLERLFRFLRPHDDIQAIKYFTAIVEPGPSRERQDALLRAFAMLPLVEIIPVCGPYQRRA